MMTTKRLGIALVIAFLLLAACSLALSQDGPRGLISRDLATPTGTVAPTPTPRTQSGFHIYYLGGSDTGVDCDEITTEPDQGLTFAWESHDETDPILSSRYFLICNLSAWPASVSVTDLYAQAYGYSIATDASIAPRLTEDRDAGSWAGYLPDSVDTVYSWPPSIWVCRERYSIGLHAGTTSGTIYPFRRVVGFPYNQYLIRLDSAATEFMNCTVAAETFHKELRYSLALPADWQPTPGPTATPSTGTNNCWISEILTRPQGVTCPDWNGRVGCGNDDEFVEVACNPAQSLAGWTITAPTAGVYTIKSDNMTGPLKVFWLDMWPTWTPTLTLPLTGTVTLANVAGTTVNTRTYETPAFGSSWAPASWTDPAGPWWSRVPSPGR